MKLEDAAETLAQLGNPTRLEVVRYLVKAGPSGVPVGSIQRQLKIPASTLTHHLKHLKGVGLLMQKREKPISGAASTLIVCMRFRIFSWRSAAVSV